MRSRFDFPLPGTRLAIIAIALALAGCSSSGPGTTTTTPSVASIALTPATDSVVPQQTLALTATAKDASGSAVSGATISWSVTPASVATISNTGVLTPTAPGTATVTALSDGKSATAAITVLNGGMVGSAGGTLTSPGGAASVVIPVGALSTSTPITVEPMASPPPATGLVTSTATDFGPTGTQFAQPVTVHLHYAAADLPSGVDPTQLQLYLRTGNAWTVVPGSTVDTAAHVITGTTTHFSGYAGCTGDCIFSEASVRVRFVIPTATVAQGGSYVASDGILDGSGDSVSITFSGMPQGITASNTTPPNGGTFGITIHVATNVAAGSYSFQVHAIPRGSTGVIGDSCTYFVYVVTPGYTITANPGNVSIIQGNAAPATLTLDRTAYTGSVALSVEQLPAGVTGSFNPASTSGNASVLTLSAAATATPGNYTIAVRGKASGLADVVTQLPITIDPASGFTLAGTPPFANVTPGGSGSTGVQATRLQQFSGGISYGSSGAPAGLTVAITATPVTDSMKVTFTATSGLATGNYPVSITGTSGSKTSTIVINVTVVPQGTITVHMDYSRCSSATQPVYLAYQDGTGPYTVAGGAGGVYAFNLTQPKGTVVAVTPFPSGTGYETTVMFGTPTDLPAMALQAACTGRTGTTYQNLTFTLASLPFGDEAVMSTPLETLFATAAGEQATLYGPTGGTVDVTGFRFNLANPTQDVRGLVARGINLPNGGNIGVLDFAGAQSFAPVQGTFTVQNAGAESYRWDEYYVTQGQSCAENEFMNSNLGSGSVVYGFPASVQLPGDLHEFVVSTHTRVAVQFSHAFTSPTIALGATLPSPSIMALSGAFKRPQVTITLPSDYQFLTYGWDGRNGLVLTGSTSFYEGQTLTMVTPDLATLPGYDLSDWAPPATTADYYMTASSSLTTTCSDGSVWRQINASGTN